MSAIRTAVLLAAGRGTRMGDLTAATPKPLLPLQGMPILEHILRGMREAGIERFVVVTGYLADRIEAYFGDGAGLGVRIDYRRQPEPSGTAAALQLARDIVEREPFALSWGDILVEPDTYSRLIATYRQGPVAGLVAVNEVDDPWRGAAVYFDADRRIREIVEKPPRGTSTTRWNNAGIFALDPIVFTYVERLPRSERGEFELPQAFAAMLAEGHDFRALPVDGFWSDLGTPEDLQAAERDFRAPRVATPS